MPNGDAQEVQFKSPTTGAVQVVPPEHWDEALSSGYQPVTHKVMYSPQGERGMVPNEQLKDYMSQGYQTTPKTSFEAQRSGGPGFWSTIGEKIASALPKSPGEYAQQVLSAAKFVLNPVGSGTEAAQEGLSRAAETAQATKNEKMPVYASRPAEIAASVASPLVPGLDPARMRAAAEKANTPGVLAEAAVPAAMAAAPLIAEGVRPVARPFAILAGEAKDVVGTALRDEFGRLKQPVRAIAATGKLIGGPEVAEALIPDRPGAATAAQRRAVPIAKSPYYLQNKAAAAAEASAASDAAAADAEARKAVPITQSPYYATNKAAIDEATRTEVEARKPVPVSQSPYYAENQAKVAAQEAAEKATAKAEAAAREPVPVTESPYYKQNKAKAAAEAKAAKPMIVSDTGGGPRMTGNEGRPATWTNERVMQLARQGNREAIQQAVRRGFELPPNVRYVAGDPNFSSGAYNPRSVTVFSPEGTPIKQGGKGIQPARPMTSAAKAAEPSYAYRVRNQGEEGVPIAEGSHAHATTTLEDAQRLKPGRETTMKGEPQEIVKIDLSKLKEGKDYTRLPREGQPDWIKLHRPLAEDEVERVKPQ